MIVKLAGVSAENLKKLTDFLASDECQVPKVIYVERFSKLMLQKEDPIQRFESKSQPERHGGKIVFKVEVVVSEGYTTVLSSKAHVHESDKGFVEVDVPGFGRFAGGDEDEMFVSEAHHFKSKHFKTVLVPRRIVARIYECLGVYPDSDEVVVFSD